MIQYSLKCDAGHVFDSWFQSAAAFESLQNGGHLSCSVCGSATVVKSVMAPRVSARSDKAADKPALPQGKIEAALKEMRAHVEKNADYVGPRFAEEARSMYLSETPERAIYGEASKEEARALVEDGVPVMPLPFTPKNKAN